VTPRYAELRCEGLSRGPLFLRARFVAGFVPRAPVAALESPSAAAFLRGLAIGETERARERGVGV
jgi:hypothetical protein